MYHAKPLNKKTRNNKHIVALSMQPYGIQTIVFTELQGLEAARTSYFEASQKSPTSREQHIQYRNSLKEYLLREDKYFDSARHEITQRTERWNAFCDYCALYAALTAALDNSPLCFIHPKHFGNLEELPVSHLGKRYLTPIPDVPVFETFLEARQAGFNI